MYAWLKKKLIASTIFSTNHFTLPSTIRPFEIPTKVKLDPNENRPYFDNLINAQSTKRHGIHRQNKQLNGLVSCCRIMLRLIKWHVYAHKMHQISGPLSVNWWQCCHKIFLHWLTIMHVTMNRQICSGICFTTGQPAII